MLCSPLGASVGCALKKDTPNCTVNNGAWHLKLNGLGSVGVEMTLWPKVLVALAEDLSLSPSTHVGKLTTTCNSIYFVLVD